MTAATLAAGEVRRGRADAYADNARASRSVETFHYKLPTRARGAEPGAHPGTQRGGGMEFQGHANLLTAQDPRRFDVAASLRDPFNQVMVRVYTQRSAVPVRVIADVSASMGFAGRCSKLELLADFVESMALSASGVGDPFSFTGCDSAIREDLLLPLTRSRAAGTLLAARLRDLTPSGRNASALLAAVLRTPPSRSLVFLVSDFHFPLSMLETLLGGLALHEVVPVVLRDSAEGIAPRYGIARIFDPETGAERTLLLRPSLARRLQECVAARFEALERCCARFGVKPLFIEDRFEADAVTRHFYG
ncbi:MAG TPA: hypothetical protein VKZ91_00400 [Woeseiaceae bacterium]|nr:hypothetical protein [Woeseiaceae bacterium]